MLDLYFIENRARLLDIASFLDRIDRYGEAEEARKDFRYLALQKALKALLEPGPGRTRTIQELLSDPTAEPIDSAAGLKAFGAWEGGAR
jgi:hypothetical protein